MEENSLLSKKYEPHLFVIIKIKAGSSFVTYDLPAWSAFREPSPDQGTSEVGEEREPPESTPPPLHHASGQTRLVHLRAPSY